MRRSLGLLLFFILTLSAMPGRASDADDAQSALTACNSNVSSLSNFMNDTTSLTSVSAAQAKINGLAVPFGTLVTALQKLNLPQGAQFISVAGNIQVKIGNATKANSYDVGGFLNICNDLKNQLAQWPSSDTDLVRALQQYVPPAAQGAIVSQLATALPTAFAAVGSGPGAGVAQTIPTATPAVAAAVPTATPMIAAATAATPVPVGDGGIIPGGWTPAPPPTPLPTMVPVPGFPTPMPTPKAQAFEPVAIVAGHNDQRVWVANVHGNSVSVMDASTQRFVANVPVGSQPQALAVDDGDNTLVVANYASNSVSLVDGRSDVLIKEIPVSAGPAQVLVTHNDKAYALCQDGHAIAVIDLKLHLLLKTINLSSRPGRMDQPNSGNHVYISLPDEDSVAVVDTGYDDVVATVKE